MKIANNWGNIITKLGIGCVVCLLLGGAILLSAQDEKKSEFIGTKSEMNAAKIKEIAAAKRQAMAAAPEQPQRQQRNRAWGRQNRGGGVDFGENAAFYRTIIDHNIFRPLGWTPPNNEPSYSLIGTKAVGSNNVISQATLLERRSNRYHFVTIGTQIGDMTVKDIQPKKVTLDKAGETVTLRTGELQLLTAKRERGGDRGGESGSERAGNNNERNRGNQAAERREQAEQREQANAEQNRRREIMERMRNASPEERRRMIERFRGNRGGDRGGRRGRGRDR